MEIKHNIITICTLHTFLNFEHVKVTLLEENLTNCRKILQNITEKQKISIQTFEID